MLHIVVGADASTAGEKLKTAPLLEAVVVDEDEDCAIQRLSQTVTDGSLVEPAETKQFSSSGSMAILLTFRVLTCMLPPVLDP